MATFPADVRDRTGSTSLLIAEAACVCMHEGITLYDRLPRYDKYGYWAENIASSTLPGKDGLERWRPLGKLQRPEKIGDFKVWRQDT